MLEEKNYTRKNNELLLNKLLALKKERDIKECIRRNKDKVMVKIIYTFCEYFQVIIDQDEKTTNQNEKECEITAYKRNIRKALR